MRFPTLLFVLGLLAALPAAGGPTAAAQAQGLNGLSGGQGAASKVEWTASASPKAVAPGASFGVRLRASVADGWKMYAVDSPPPSRGVRVHLDSLGTGLARGGALRQSEPKRGYDPNFDKEVTYFAGRAEVTAPVAVATSAEPGPKAVRGTVEFMVCTQTMCLPPTRTPFSASVTVANAAPTDVPNDASSDAASDRASAPSPTTRRKETDGPTAGTAATGTEKAGEGARQPGPREETAGGKGGGEDEKTASGAAAASAPARSAGGASGGGVWGFLLLAVAAGGAALLTPCVFPMIPLTVSFFTNHADSPGGAARAALAYGVSIVATFTGLGAAMAVFVGAAGAQSVAANPWVNLFIGLVFVLFALSLLGLFDLRLPSGLVNYFNRQGTERAGYAGVVFMGLTLTLVSFSCTAPFVGGLLAATAGGEWFLPVVGMMAFSTTFALPFVGFALFPKALDSLPTSGAWMNVVKVTLGFVELAAALKFLSNADLIWGTGLLSRPLAIALTVVIFFVAGLYLLGKLRLAGEPAGVAIGPLRLVAAMAFLGLALYMVPGLFGARLGAIDAYLPPKQASDVSLAASMPGGGGAAAGEAAAGEAAPAGGLAWHTDDVDAAFAEARAEGRPVFIDFTGYTCTNCRAMEANVFPQPEVARRFRQDFVLLRLYTDDLPDGTTYQRLQLEMTGTTALPTYAVVAPEDRSVVRTVSGTMSAERFAAFLERGAEQFRQERIAEAR
jgi:thiol:disulfide interchange protein DsbD